MPDGCAEPDVRQVHEDERQQEIWNSNAQHSQKGEAIVAPTVLMSCRVNSDWKGNQPGEQNGCKGNQNGQKDAAADEI